MGLFWWDPTMIILIPAILLSLYASAKVKTTYSKYKKIRSRSGCYFTTGEISALQELF